MPIHLAVDGRLCANSAIGVVILPNVRLACPKHAVAVGALFAHLVSDHSTQVNQLFELVVGQVARHVIEARELLL